MLRSLTILTAAFTLAGSAVMAAPTREISVTVQLGGKDADAIHRDIVKAARRVCRQAAPDSVFASYASHAACVQEAVMRAEGQLQSASRAQEIAAK
jgi:UrcA family protein